MKFQNKTVGVLLLLAFFGFCAGWILGSINEKNKKVSSTGDEIWTCSMHPEVQMPKPGKCPKCAMDLILLDKASKGDNAVYEMSPLAEKLAEIEVSEVERKIMQHEISLVGKVHYDERHTSTISAWFPSRIDRLFVDFTGVKVQKGDHLAMQYSPDLLAAQEELIEASKRVEAMKQDSFLKKSNLQLLNSAKEKLRLWGLSTQQIKEIQKAKKSSDHMEIQSTQNGVVIKKFVNEGDYVKTGDKLFTVGNQERLWVFLDVYESELPFIFFGQEVSLESEAYPGRFFHGTVSFIQPELNDQTRTVRIRVNVDNKDLRLKPGMLINAKVRVTVGDKGLVSYPDFSGKWVCPMHPEIMRDVFGKCDLCQMALVKTETLNMNISKPIMPALVIPETSVLLTGKRAVVYTKLGHKYEGHEVVLGPKVGRYYIVIEGLEEGDLVVTKGNFKIDSSLQIIAKPSMMKNKWLKDGSQFIAKFKTKMSPIENTLILKPAIETYLKISESLAKDEFKSLEPLLKKWEISVLKAIDDKTLSKSTLIDLKLIHENVLMSKAHTKNIESFRKIWELASEAMVRILNSSGNPTDKVVYTAYCPMVKKSWLQWDEKVNNPFYGSSMLECGEIRKSKEPKKKNSDNRAISNSFLIPLFQKYIELNTVLAADDFVNAKKNMKDMFALLKPLRAHKTLSTKSLNLLDSISAILKHSDHFKGIKEVRKQLVGISNYMLALQKINGNPLSRRTYTAYCSMANASWIQLEESIKNPYYGKDMLDCGDIKSSNQAQKKGE